MRPSDVIRGPQCDGVEIRKRHSLHLFDECQGRRYWSLAIVERDEPDMTKVVQLPYRIEKGPIHV
jgi:hypothetical protein